MGVETRGTAFLVLGLLRGDIVDEDGVQAIVDDMIDAGWYWAPDRYAKLLQTIEELG